jgi:hypothetical protein
MMEGTKTIRTLIRKMGAFKLHVKKFMKEHKINKLQLQEQSIPPLMLRTGLCKKEKVNLRLLKIELEKEEKKMIAFE